MFSLVTAVLLLSPLISTAASAQAVCLPSSHYNFLKNSKGEDPCNVADQVLTVCTGTGVALGQLGSSGAYAGPTSTAQNQWPLNRCLCSQPVYNLIMACTDCQAAPVVSFQQFTAACTNQAYTGADGFPTLVLPGPLPNTVTLPGFAEGLDSAALPGGLWTEQAVANFNAGAAATVTVVSTGPARTTRSSTVAIASVITITVYGTPAGTATVTSITDPVPSVITYTVYIEPTGFGAPPPPLQTTSSSIPTSGKNSSSHTGAIIGGSIGGIILLALIGILIAFFLMSRRKRGSEYDPAMLSGARPISGFDEDPYGSSLGGHGDEMSEKPPPPTAAGYGGEGDQYYPRHRGGASGGGSSTGRW